MSLEKITFFTIWLLAVKYFIEVGGDFNSTKLCFFFKIYYCHLYVHTEMFSLHELNPTEDFVGSMWHLVINSTQESREVVCNTPLTD